MNAALDKSKKVLIVDDETQILNALTDQLEEKFEVHATDTPQQAIRFAENEEGLSVVLCDQRMPNMQGDQLLAVLEKISPATRVLITGYADMEAVIRAVNDGHIFAYVTKPWEAEELELTIHKAVEYYDLNSRLNVERKLLHDLMKHSDDGIYFKDATQRFLRANDKVARLMGVEHPDDLIGKTVRDLFSNGTAGEISALEQRVLSTNEPVIGHRRSFVTAEGGARWYSESIVSIEDGERGSKGLIGISRDVTREHLSQQGLELLFEVSKVLEATKSEQEALAGLLETVCAYTKWPYAETWRYDSEREGLTLSPLYFAEEGELRDFHAAALDRVFAKGGGLPGKAWAKREAVLIRDLFDGPGSEVFKPKAVAQSVGLQAGFAVPVLSGDGDPICITSFFLYEVRPEDENLFEVVASAVRQLGDHIMRKRAETALRKSEKNYHTIVEHQTELICRFLPDGTPLFVNDALARFFGRGVDDCAKYNAWKDIAGAQRELAEREIDGLRPDSPVTRFEAQLQRSDGGNRTIEWTLRGIFSDGGALAEVHAVGRDITDRKLAEMELVKNRKQMRDFAKAASDWWWELDHEMRFSFISDAVEDCTGYSPHDLLYSPPSVLAKDPSSVSWKSLFIALDGQKIVKDCECEIITMQGDARICSFNAIPRFDIEGGFLGYRGTVKDVTAAKRAVHDLRESEERFRQVAEHIREVFWLFDVKQGKIIYVSPAYEEIWGIKRETLYQNPRASIEVIHPDDRARVEAVIAKQAERPYELEFRIIAPDGKVRWIKDRATPVKNDQGEVYRIVGIGEDITSSKKAVVALQRSEERFRSIFSEASHGIVVHRGEDILYANQGAAELFGVNSVEELLDREDFFACFAKEDRGSQRRYSESVMAGAQTNDSLESRILRNDGAQRIVESRSVRIPWDEEEAVCINLFDVTEHHDLQSQLHHSQKMEAIGQLTGGVAHDFNNILTIVMGNLELLEEQLEKDPSLGALAKSALHAAERGADLTRQLLAFSRQQPMAPTTVDPADTLKQFLEMLCRTIGGNIDLVFQCPEEVRPITVDVGMLENALLNLCVNARDAMPDGGQITVALETGDIDELGRVSGLADGAYTRISVRDTGSGIPRSLIERVTEPFFSTKGQGKGTGLGLSMVYGFAKQSGGQLEIESEEGEGTTMHLYFPVSAATPQDVSNGTESALPDALEGVRILYVEDDPDVRATVGAMLERLGCAVTYAEQASEGLRAFEKNPNVDLVVTDVIMPGQMTGLDMVGAIREHNRKVPVVVCTGHAGPQPNESLEAFEPATYLAKPFSRAQFIDTATRLLDLG